MADTDDALVERVAKIICCPPHLAECSQPCSRHYFAPTARAAIAVLRPVIRAEALEEAALMLDEVGCCPVMADTTAAAIRAMKEET